MAETTENLGSVTPPFRSVTFNGYSKEDVNAYMEEVVRTAKRERDEAGALRMKVADLSARIEAVQQDSELKTAQLAQELASTRDQLRTQNNELDRAKLEIDRLDQLSKSLQAERDSFQKVAEKLSNEEQQAKELLKAATRTADVLRQRAKADSEALVNRAEANAQRMEGEARRRVDDLKREYERIRKEHDEFLKEARETAQNLVRKIDDARSKWPV